MGDMLNKGNKFLSPVLGHYTELEVESAKGIKVYTTDGREYIDFSSGVAVANTGHCHPQVVQAITDQAKKLIHISAGVAYCAPNVDLAQKLVQITDVLEGSVYFAQSGTEAIEASLKLAKYVSGKKKIVAYTGAFHGRTLASLSVTYKDKFKKGYEEWIIEDIVRIKYPYCFRCPYGASYGKCKFECVSDMKQTILNDTDVAAVIIEPIMGEGGYIPAPVQYIQELRRFTLENNIFLIFDEIQTGFGRTGTMFAKEHYDVTPDIYALAKGIASGLPLSACVAKKEIMDKWTKSAHGGTFLGNPICCAAALATIDVIDNEKLLENAYNVGQYIKNALKELQGNFPVIGDVRGFGLMIGIEFVYPENNLPNPDLVLRLRKKALEKGLILISCGDNDQVIRLIPPLIISMDEAKNALDILVDCLKESL